MDSRFLNL
jgi:P-type Ca2+ transporter type 2C